jgi:hypothetical protein
MVEHQLSHASSISAEQLRQDREKHRCEMAQLKEQSAETLRQSEELLRDVKRELARR